MTTKIAPRLQEIVEDLYRHPDFLKTDHEVCKRELRALLAVARAAQRVAADSEGDPLAVEHACALDRALERLAKAER